MGTFYGSHLAAMAGFQSVVLLSVVWFCVICLSLLLLPFDEVACLQHVFIYDLLTKFTLWVTCLSVRGKGG